MSNQKTWHLFIVLDGLDSEWFMNNDEDEKKYGLTFNDTPFFRRAAIESIRRRLEIVLGVEDE